MKTAAMGLALSVLFACGKIDKQSSTTQPIDSGDAIVTPPKPIDAPDALMVASLAEAPKCTEETEGKLVYSRAQNMLASCVSGSWTFIAPSAADRLVGSIYCQMMASQESLLNAGLDKAPVGGMNFFYTINEFANGMRFVQARIATGGESYTSSMFWHRLQENSKNAPSQQIILDLAGDLNFGLWEFRVDSQMTGDPNNSAAVVYSDESLEGDRLLPFDQQKDCTIVNFEGSN